MSHSSACPIAKVGKHSWRFADFGGRISCVIFRASPAYPSVSYGYWADRTVNSHTYSIHQSTHPLSRLLHFLNGLVVIWITELAFCVYFVSIDLYDLWRVWFNVVIHTSIMLIATVGGLAIANDRISAIPEAAMLATPLNSDMILQIASARMIFGMSAQTTPLITMHS